MPFFFLLFIVVPLVEIGLFIKVGGAIGVFLTVALVIVTAAAGVALLRWQGVATLMRARERMAGGQMPAREMVEGIMLAIAGAMLLTPGFFTDAVGFALLVPACRHALFNVFKNRIVVADLGGSGRRTHRDDAHTFDGEYHREDDPGTDRDSLPPKK